jgi:beta-N-acetylhexosaminidase
MKKLKLLIKPNQKVFARILLVVSIFVFTVITLALIYFSKTSLLASIRSYLLFSILIISFSVFLVGCKIKSKIIVIPSLGFTLVASLIVLHFQLNKLMFFYFQGADLHTNKHLILGYRNDTEIKNLVKQNKIAGVYITARNIRGKSKQQVKSFIRQLQLERKKHSNTQLIIMADQEGGVVSHLSPMLTQTDTLGKVLQKSTSCNKGLSYKDKQGKCQDILSVASIHGKELQEIGVNVNLSPVADLKNQNSAKGYSQINKRAISEDPKVVKKVVEEYCLTLWEYQVKCAIKHFPGIGDVDQDTHFQLGIKRGSLKKVWRDASTFEPPKAPHLVMVSHSKIEIIDNQNPASVSQKSINFLKQVNPDAKIITDDFSMLPISKDIGIKKAYIQSLEAGTDYILISYDKELAYQLW